MHPLAVGDVLLMRTVRNLLAVDFVTGKRLWEASTEETDDPDHGATVGDARLRQAMLAAGLGQRMWGDSTYGTLSSDGRRVFSVEDPEAVAQNPQSGRQNIGVPMGGGGGGLLSNGRPLNNKQEFF